MAVISTDTTWTTNQSDTSGYTVVGCTLTIDAVAKGSDLTVIFGASSSGDIKTEDNGKIISRTNDTCKVYLGGTSGSKANACICYGSIETDYQGSTDTITTFIGSDGTNATCDGGHAIYPQARHVLENVFFDTTYTYCLYENVGSGLLYKNCKIGTHGTYALRTQRSNIIWFEDCDFITTGAYWCNLAGGAEINLVGNNELHGKTHQSSVLMEIIRYWKRAYPQCKDSVPNNLEGVIVSLTQKNGYNGRSGITASDGKIDEDNEMWGQDYLIGLWKTYDDFNGWIIYASAALKHKLLTYLNGYTTSSTEVDMSSDYGSSSAFETITMAADATPVISNPAFDDVTITQDQELTCTCTLTNTTYAYIEFTDPGTDTDSIYIKYFTISGTDGTCIISPGALKIGEYGSAEIRIVAVNVSGESDIDSSLTLTVSASDKNYQHQVATALVSLIQADARFDDFNDDDIFLASSEEQVEEALRRKSPSMGIIPLENNPVPSTITEREHVLTVRILTGVIDHKKTQKDTTQMDKLQTYEKAIMDLCEEQYRDPDKRLSGLVNRVRAESEGLREITNRPLVVFLSFVKVTAKLFAE